MDNVSHKIVKYMVAQSKEKNFECSYTSEHAYRYDTCSEELAKKLEIPLHDFISAVVYLAEIGYIENNNYAFWLTHSGKQSDWFRKNEIKMFFLKSIFVPIAVSIITTLAIGGLQSSWPKISQWFSNFL